MLIFTYMQDMFPLMEIQVGLINRNQISICPLGISTPVSTARSLLSGLQANWPPHFSPHTERMLLSHCMHVLTSLHMDPLLQVPVPCCTVDPHPSRPSTLWILFLESLSWAWWLMISKRIGLAERVPLPWQGSILQTHLAFYPHFSWNPQGWSIWGGIQGNQQPDSIWAVRLSYMNELKETLSAAAMGVTAVLTGHLYSHLQKTIGNNKITNGCCLK